MIDKILRVLQNMFTGYLIRPLNQICRYDLPSENNGWKKQCILPVYGNLSTRSVFDPYVFKIDKKFVMVVSERLYHGIDMLESEDGFNWTKKSTILQRVPYTWQNIVNRASIVYHNGLWHLWYTGQFNNISQIGHTVSDSCLVFKNATNPCLTADLESEGVSVMNPCVIWNDHKQIFQMWYAAGDNYEPDAIFYAESLNGDNWIKRPEPVLVKYPAHKWEQYKVGGCQVVRDKDGTYTIYYIGYQNVDVARICIAHSKDGINWVRPENNLLISPTKGSWDADATYKPAVVEKEGTLYMWYNGRRGHEEYIGLATKKSLNYEKI